jgi:hypothetical protein
MSKILTDRHTDGGLWWTYTVCEITRNNAYVNKEFWASFTSTDENRTQCLIVSEFICQMKSATSTPFFMWKKNFKFCKMW